MVLILYTLKAAAYSLSNKDKYIDYIKIFFVKELVRVKLVHKPSEVVHTRHLAFM